MKKLFILLLLPALAFADSGEYPHLKQDNPDELQYHVTVGTEASCPIKVEAVEEVVRGVFVRSRIKPARSDMRKATNRELFLYVSLKCYDAPEITNAIYDLEVGFGQRLEVRDWNLPVRFFVSGVGSIGVGDNASIRSTVQEIIEGEITDYLLANFDLGEDEG